MRLCKICDQALPERANFCLRCGTATKTLPDQRPGNQPQSDQRSSVDHNLSYQTGLAYAIFKRLNLGRQIAFAAGIVIVISYAIAISRLDHHEKPAIRPTTVLPELIGEGGELKRLHPLPANGIDFPSLAFQTKDSVDRVFGKPLNDVRDSNISTFQEGDLRVRKYRRAECRYQSGRLISIDYSFGKGRPSTLENALELVGLPPAAANLNKHHLPFRAMYTPDPDYRNPVRCCGMLIYMVIVPEDLSRVTVMFANPNYRFVEWPQEIQDSWMRAVGKKP